jgi:hypothetical protein
MTGPDRKARFGRKSVLVFQNTRFGVIRQPDLV